MEQFGTICMGARYAACDREPYCADYADMRRELNRSSAVAKTR